MPIEPEIQLDSTATRQARHSPRLRISLFILAALLCIFWLPRFIPTPPSVSCSYVFGYNNRAGVLLLLAFLVTGGFLFGRRDDSPSIGDRQSRVPTRVIAVWMIISLLCAAGMYFFVHGLGGFADSGYLVDRVKALSAGKVPYRDFEFAYGPLFLYGPLALMRIFGLDAETSYYIFWVACTVAGIWLLAKIVQLLDCPANRKTAILSLFSALSVPLLLWTAINCSLLRFIPPVYFALVIDRVVRDKRKSPLLLGCGLSLLAALSTMLIAPEEGVGFAVGSIAYFGFFGWKNGWLRNKGEFLAYLCFCGLEGAIFWIAVRLQLFQAVKEFGSRGNNFPIIPSGHILLFFLCCAIVSAWTVGSIRAGSPGDGRLFVVFVSAPMLFAALGRCDPFHIGLDGFGILLVAAALASARPRMWTVYQASFLVFLVVLPTYATYWFLKGQFARVAIRDIYLVRRTDHETWLDRLMERQARGTGMPDFKAKLSRLRENVNNPHLEDPDANFADISRPVAAPLGYFPNSFTVYHSDEVELGYFYGLLNAFTPEAVARKVDELKSLSTE